MNKSTYYLITLSLLIIGCKKEVDPFLVGKQNIGLLTDSTQVKDLDLIFPNDSIIKHTGDNGFSSNENEIQIFEKGGNKLLVLELDKTQDSTSLIKSVQIMDSRYKTDKNISTLSTFKDINENYKISKITNLINSVVVFVDEIDASFTIDKKELPSDLRFDMTLTIEKIQIPDKAKIKYFFVYWN